MLSPLHVFGSLHDLSSGMIPGLIQYWLSNIYPTCYLSESHEGKHLIIFNGKNDVFCCVDSSIHV